VTAASDADRKRDPTDLGLPGSDADDHKREQHRERQRKHRERRRFYGEPGEGYVITQRVTPGDYLDKLAGRFPAIAEAKKSGDKEELGRALDWLEAAVAEGTLASFEEDYEPGKLVV
jgi:hypothetical protein